LVRTVGASNLLQWVRGSEIKVAVECCSHVKEPNI